MKTKTVSSAVRVAAQRIRRDLLKLSDGDLIGSEDDMVERYGVSRPTLRQAATILAHEQLLFIRRGVGGGYFARVPETHGVAQTAAVYLLAHSTTMREIIEAVAPIKAELAILACRCQDPDVRRELLEYSRSDLPTGEDLYRSFLRSERAFSRILGRMSNNKVLNLFLTILNDFCAQIPPEKDVYRHHPERVEAYSEARSRLVRSILDGDEQVAAVHAKRCARMVEDWMTGDESHLSPRTLDNMLDMIAVPETQPAFDAAGTA